MTSDRAAARATRQEPLPLFSSYPYLDMWEIEEEEEAVPAWAPPESRRATWTMTLPVRIPLKMAMASECDRPDVECPFTERISSPAERMRIQDKHAEHNEACA